jgi:hypothetical protein
MGGRQASADVDIGRMSTVAPSNHQADAFGWSASSRFDDQGPSSGRCPAASAEADCRAMPLVRVNDPAAMPELVAALRENGCLAAQVRHDACIVSLPFGDDEYLAVELGFFLKAWRQSRPAFSAEVIA